MTSLLLHHSIRNERSLDYLTTKKFLTVTVVSVGIVPVQNDSQGLDTDSLNGLINKTVTKMKHKFDKTFTTSTTTSTREPSTTTATLPSTTTTTPYTTPTTTTTTRRFTAVPPRPPIGRTHEASAAITIIIISAVLIVIIVITILVLLFSRKNETNYKIESHKSFSHHQSQTERKPCSQVLLPNESSHLHAQSSLLIPSSNISDNMRIVGKVKKRQDVKEWYV